MSKFDNENPYEAGYSKNLSNQTINNPKSNKNRNKQGSAKKRNNDTKVVMGLYGVVASLVVGAGALTVHNFNQASSELVSLEEVSTSQTVSGNTTKPLAETIDAQTDVARNSAVTTIEPETEKEEPTDVAPTDDATDKTSEENNEEQKDDTGTKESTASEFKTASLQVPVVNAQVLVPYSEKLVYDKTLEQYHTNEAVRFSSKVGDKVLAAAKGKVVEVAEGDEGNYVVIDHGDGFTTTYGQLGKDITVQKGDTVERGEVIGVVAEPSRLFTALTPHVSFKVVKDKVAVNPEQYFTEVN